jgi:hypothetical protein
MRTKHFDWEQAFAFIWNHADRDGIWAGDAKMLAAKFHVTEDEAHEVLSDLCDRGLIQRVGRRDYIIMKWRERDDPDAEEMRWSDIVTGLRDG